MLMLQQINFKFFVLNENIILECFQNDLEYHLQQQIKSKNYYAGEYKGFDIEKNSNSKNNNDIIFSQEKENKIIYAKDKVRIDTNSISIERYLSLSQLGSKNKNDINKENNDEKSQINNCNQQIIKNSVFEKIYKSMFIDDENDEKNNKNLTEILKKGFFVGLDFQNDYLFIEYMTSLYIIIPKNLFTSGIFFV